jgi:E3 ubiquitin-protein ligase HERC2
VAFAIGEDGELFSWGSAGSGLLGHGDWQAQHSPKRVEALRGVRMSSVAVGSGHALALSEDGLVYAWCWTDDEWVSFTNPHVERALLPKPVEALCGVRVSSVTVARSRSYALADTGELWVSGGEHKHHDAPLGHGEQMDCPLPKPIASLQAIKVDAVAAHQFQTLALADDGSVYVWGHANAARSGALGLGSSASDARMPVPTPQRIPGLRVACGLW